MQKCNRSYSKFLFHQIKNIQAYITNIAQIKLIKLLVLYDVCICHLEYYKNQIKQVLHIKIAQPFTLPFILVALQIF